MSGVETPEEDTLDISGIDPADIAGRDKVDWPVFHGMMDELRRIKGLDTDGKLGSAIGSRGVPYNWRKRASQPTVENLIKLATYAAEPPVAPHLCEVWRWMEAAGRAVAPDGKALDNSDRNLLAISHALTTLGQRERLVDLALLWFRAVSEA